MSNNGNGHRPPTPDELRALVDEGQKMGAYKPDAASDRLLSFVELVAEAFEVLGFKENTLGHHAFDRIIGSDRKEKAELLRRLADSIDPVNDEARIRKLHHQERVPANGLPRIQDFLDLLPPTLCDALDIHIEGDEELDRAELEATAQRNWELPSNTVRLYIRARMASHDAWGHFENHHVPDSFVPSDYVPSKYEEHLPESFIQVRKGWQEKQEYYKEDVAALTYQIANDLDWLRNNRDTEDAIFNKIMSTEPTGHGPLWDLDLVINNWDFAPCT